LDAWWVTLLREQQSDGFLDLAGTDASITLPISDRLISRVVAQRLPAHVPVREFDLFAHEGGVIAIRVRLAKPTFLPPIQLRLAIDQQPELPHSPILGLAIVSQGVAALAAGALKFADVLPPSVRFDGRRFIVDLRAMLERQNAAGVLEFLTHLRITTAAEQVVVHARAAVRVPAR
jgi:hypothetical protein